MSDTISDLGTLFDTLVAPAGDASVVNDALNAADTGNSVADVASTATDAASSVADGAANIDTSAAANPVPVPDAAADPGATTDSGIAPGEQMPKQPSEQTAPASSSQAPAPVTDLSTQANSGGIIDKASQYAKEHPGEAGILGKVLAGGATGAMTALALKNKMQAAKEAEERSRQDTIRRGQVTALAPGTFTPKKPPGIIDAHGG